MGRGEDEGTASRAVPRLWMLLGLVLLVPAGAASAHLRS